VLALPEWRKNVMSVQLHHVALVARDPEQSVHFYRSIFGFARLERPPFNIEGVWLECGPGLQLHLTKHLPGTFRTGGVDNNDGHFALRTDDFEGILSRLEEAGYAEDAPEGDPKKMIVNRSGLAGFLQLYVMDPDRNVIEVNTAA
jgi:catechol 2,3-dioxygenase-like lactoylglutathione lyase family enzyme